MKITINAPCGIAYLETESLKDLYMIGRIAKKFDSFASNDENKPRRVEIPLDKLIEELAR